MIKRRLLFLIIGITLLSLSVVEAVEIAEDGTKITPDKTTEAIKIDSELNEKVWSNKPITEEFIIGAPVYGKPLAQKTKIWIAYDKENLYFAFQCFDDEPQKLKSEVTHRDLIFREDLIGILIDSMGTHQTGYEFYINPRGIQGDGLNSSASGSDMAPDFVWESASKITDFGYQAELCIPLKTIAFKSGKDVKMKMLFVRQVSRTGTSATWPRMPPGQTDFNSTIAVNFKDLKPKLKREVLPNFVYRSNRNRATETEWADAEVTKDIGVMLSMGLTSSVTAEVTINPDFSQVESDAYQVEVNNRYPVFHLEKRPFFMEGSKTFDYGLTMAGDLQLGMLGAAIHTRRIVDPGWAAKISGNVGRLTFGILGANDRAPETVWGDIAEADPDKDAYWAIARGKYSLGGDNSIGLLYSGSFLGEGKNNTLGMDLQYRLGKNSRLFAGYLHTESKLTPDSEKNIGSGFNSMVTYTTKRFGIRASYERYDKEFNMHSAHINRIGLSQYQIWMGPSFYPKAKGLRLFRRVQPWFTYILLKDMFTGLNDRALHYGVNINYKGLVHSEMSLHDLREAWQGQIFDLNFFHFWLYGQLTNWFQTQIYFWVGDQIYYHPTDPFLGTGPRGLVEITLEPTRKLRINFDWNFNRFKRKSTKEEVFDFNIINARATYQFNKHFLVRAAVRYNDYYETLLTDLLASFTLIPGTVMHLGYGSFYENMMWQNQMWMPGTGNRMLRMRDSLFFKVSYLWQIK